MKHFRKIALVLSIILASENIFGQGWTINPADYSSNGTVTAVVFHGTNEVTTGTLGAFVGGICRGFADGVFFPPTGKTVFTVMCYSNLTSGETLTFQYFDPSDNSFYNINETIGFVADMIVGDAMSPVNFHTVPIVYDVTGGGSYCQGGSGLPVGLADSELGVTYTLIKNTVATSTTYVGTGSSFSFGNQLSGTYTVSGVNAGGTTNMTGSAIITENATPIAPTVMVVNNCNSTSTLTASGYTGTLLWSTTETTASITVNTAGTYTVTQTVNGCTSSPGSGIAAPKTTPIAPTVAVVNNCNSTSTLTASGYTGTLLWSTAETTPSITGNTAGTYTVTQTVNGCTSSPGSGIAAPKTTPVAPTVTVVNNCNSTSTLTASGYTGTLLWSTSETTPSITVNTAGTYTVTQTVNGCTSSAGSGIAAPKTTPAAPTGTASQSFCSGTSPTVASLIATGTAIQWYSASGGGSALAGSTALVNGTHYYASQTVSGCESTSRFDVTATVNTTPAAPTGMASQSFCSGTSPTVASLTATGTAIQWYSASGGGIALAGSTALVNGTNYYASQTVSGCESTSRFDVIVTVTPSPTASAGSALSAICQGSTSASLGGSIGGSATGGTWSTPAGGIFNPAPTTLNSTWTPPPGYSGSATLTLTTFGGACGTASSSKTEIVNPNAVITLTSGVGTNLQALCINTAITNITYSVTGGGTGAGISGLPTGVNGVYSGGVFNISGTPTVAGTFIYMVTTTGTCSQATATGTIIVNPNAAITLTSGAGTNLQTLCANSSITNIVYSVSGGGSGAGATGLPSGVNGVYNGGVFTISGIPTVSGAFNYTVTTTGTCIQASLSGTLTVNSLPIPTLTSSAPGNVSCQGASVTFTAGGGTNYNFRVGGMTVQNGPSTTYTTTTLTNGKSVDVIVTNTNGCTATFTPPIISIVNLLPIIFVSTPANCSSDLTTYSLAVFVSTGTVTSTSGIVTNTGGSIWTITGVLAGINVTVTVTDSGGCQNAITITAPNCSCPVVLPPVSGGDKYYCASGVIPAITATILTGETVDWYDSSSGGTLLRSGSLSYTPTAPGTYYALTRNTTSNCVSSTRTPVTVTMNPLPIPSLISSDADNIFCAGTSVTFTGGGGTNYNFRVGGSSVQNGTSATYTTNLLTTGQVVDVIVTNANGCTATSAAITNTVNALPTPTLTSSDADNKFCAGTSVIFTAGGGTSYNFTVGGLSVQNGALATYTTNSLTNGQVVGVIVTNSNGCTATLTGISNTVYALPTPTLTSSDPDNIFCAGTSVTFTATGGTLYNFRVNSVSKQNGASPTYTTNSLTDGQFVDVIVTNANGCIATSSVITNTVNGLPAAVLISSDADNAFCAGTSVTFTAGGGTSYNFRVNGSSKQSGSSTTYTTNSLTDGQSVDVIVTNGSGCSTTSAQIVNTVYSLPVPTLISSAPGNISCQGTSVTFTAGGGINYNFRVTGITVQNGASITYTTSSLLNGQGVDVIVTNGNGCTATSSTIINFVNPLPLILISTPPACSADLKTYSLAVTVNTGTVTSTSGTVTNTGGNVWTITAVLKGTNITVTVTDSGGCQNTVAVTAPDCSCPVVQPAVSGGDKSYCASGTIPVINATVLTGETIDWYSAATGGTLLQTGSLTYTPAAAGDYYAQTRNIITSCVSSTRTKVTVTMNPLPIPTLSSSDADNKFCSGTSVTFTAGGGASYNFLVGATSVQNGSSATYTTSSLTTGQVVKVIVTSAFGCVATSSPITNTVYALPVPTLSSSDADNAFCAGTSVTFTAGGGISYNFRVGGISVQSGAAASYTTTTLTDGQIVDVIVTNANGCTATSTGITNTVYPIPTPTLTSSDADNIFCAGTSVTFTAGGGANYNFMIGAASVQNGSSAIYTTSSLTTGQVVKVIVTSAFGCVATSASITNTVNQIPTANAGTGGNECDLTFKFNAVPSIGIGTWIVTSGPGTATFAPDANTAAAIVTVSEYGTYIFTWTEVSNNCSRSSNITVNFYQQPVANAGTGGNNCGSEFYLKAVPSVGTGTWTKTAGIGTSVFTPGANDPNALVAVSAFGIYSFKWTEVNGTCLNSQTISVNFLQVPPANAGVDASVCGPVFVLKAIPGTGTTGTWAKLSGPGNVIFSPDAHQPDATVTIDKYGIYNFAWTEVTSTCQSTDVVNVVFHEIPAVSAGRDTIICLGGSTQLLATGTGSGSFIWKPTLFLDNPNISDPVASPDTSTNFMVSLTDQFGCKDSDDVRVNVWKKPVANAGPDLVLEYLFGTTMSANEPGTNEKGTWSVISGSGEFSDTTDARTNVSGLTLGENILKWRLSNSVCPPSDDSLTITVHNLVIPTLITPNMDGKNDYFVLRGLETLGKTELIIFDRRGVQVYKNTNYDNSWNGVDYNGKALVDDTYYYVIRSENGKSLSGYIVIRR